MQTFKVTNFKGIVGTVEVSTDGGSVVVTGQNEGGKSSFIDGITELFDARGIRFTPWPINHAADEAESEFIDTELDVRVVRKWKRDANGEVSTTYAAFSLDGARKKSPASVVAELLGGTMFDPSKFWRLDPQPQRDELLRRVELPFDLDELEREEERAVQLRLEAGQVARAAEGAVTNADRPAPGTPAEPVSTSGLVAELDSARAHNADIQRAADLAVELGKHVVGVDNRISVLKSELQKLEDERVSLNERREQAEKFEAEHDLIPTAELELKIQNVDEINRNVQLGQILRKLEAEASEKRSSWKDAEAAVEAIQQRKADGLNQAVFPHPKLSVSTDGVMFGGVPLKNVNRAQREEAVFAIATAGEPDLKLIVMDGESMDEHSLARMDQMARERGFTVLIERGRPDHGGLVAEFVEMKEGQRA